MSNQVPAATALDHFGEPIRAGRYGLRVTRETYLSDSRRHHKPMPRAQIAYLRETNDPRYKLYGARFEDDEWRVYRPEFAEKIRKQALLNFDLNMAFFKSLSADGFDLQIHHLRQQHPQLKQVHNLADWEGIGGIYIMVLGRYHQIYVGQSNNIRKRVRSHWSGAMAISKAVFGKVTESVLSIDSFRMQDTTRLFVIESPDVQRDRLEHSIEAAVEDKYVLNRVDGGRPDSARLLFMGAEARKRDL